MPESMWIDILLAISCAACGGMCGWMSHAMGGPITLTKNGQTPGSSDDYETAVASRVRQSDDESLARVAESLQAHAQSMSVDVDQHQQKVDSINDQLRDSEETTPELIAEMVQQLIAANQTMQGQLRVAQDQVHQQTLALATAEQRAKTDALTRISNRGALDEHLAARFDLGPMMAAGVPHAGVLALMDVDHFKRFNDDYGHLAGDEVLRVVAGLLHCRLQQYGIVARYGGEEFGIVMDGHTIETAAPILENVRREISRRIIPFENKQLQVSASMGVAVLQNDDTIDRWIERADQGLYKSKESGRDCGHAMMPSGPERICLGDENDTVAGVPSPDASPDDEPKSAPTDDSPTHPAPAKSSSNTLESVGSAENPSVLSPLSYLPDRDAMAAKFEEIRSRSSDVEMSLMLLRCSQATPATKMKSLLPVVRSNLRNVDMLGYHDDQTLMIVLPSVTQAAAESRGAEMISAAQGLGLAGEQMLRLGVANLEPDETFDELLEVVLMQVSAE